MSGPPLYFCRICGAYAQVRAVNLAEVCGGKEGAKEHVLRRILDRNLHPVYNITVGRPRRVESVVFASSRVALDFSGGLGPFGSLGGGLAPSGLAPGTADEPAVDESTEGQRGEGPNGPQAPVARRLWHDLDDPDLTPCPESGAESE